MTKPLSLLYIFEGMVFNHKAARTRGKVQRQQMLVCLTEVYIRKKNREHIIQQRTWQQLQPNPWMANSQHCQPNFNNNHVSLGNSLHYPTSNIAHGKLQVKTKYTLRMLYKCTIREIWWPEFMKCYGKKTWQDFSNLLHEPLLFLNRIAPMVMKVVQYLI